jgi:choline dehydrogenase
VGKLLNDERFVWKVHTEPEAQLHGNRLYWPSGRIVGGSSSVNGLVYVRGHPAKYDAWRDAGCPGWGHADVLPYFKKLEDCAFGDPAVRGRGDPSPCAKPSAIRYRKRSSPPAPIWAIRASRTTTTATRQALRRCR